MRKHNVNEINLRIDNMEVGEDRILFNWSSSLGWGQYSLFKDRETGEWIADSECMDCNEDKDFGKKLFELFMDKVQIQ